MTEASILISPLVMERKTSGLLESTLSCEPNADR
jgi:hypothetical protein